MQILRLTNHPSSTNKTSLTRNLTFSFKWIPSITTLVSVCKKNIYTTNNIATKTVTKSAFILLLLCYWSKLYIQAKICNLILSFLCLLARIIHVFLGAEDKENWQSTFSYFCQNSWVTASSAAPYCVHLCPFVCSWQLYWYRQLLPNLISTS